MSSTDCDYFFHWAKAADTRAFAAASGASLLKYGRTTLATCELDRNSQIPSLASMTILSWGFSTVYVISGSQEHPTECATVSPSDLDIASPGLLIFFTHTLWGPLNRPRQSWACMTLPPMAQTLAFSFGLSGLWSYVSYLILTFPWSSEEMRMHRESPTLAV